MADEIPSQCKQTIIDHIKTISIIVNLNPVNPKVKALDLKCG